MDDFYKLLGVYPPIDVNALRSSYRKAVFEYHPDHNPGREDWAIEMTMKVVDAYRTLGDERLRREYDFLLAYPLRRDSGELEGAKKMFGLGGEKPEVKQARELFTQAVRLAEKEEGWNQAVMGWKKAVDLFPGLANGWYNMAVIFARGKNFKDAETAIRKAKEAAPEDSKIMKAVADLSKLRMVR